MTVIHLTQVSGKTVANAVDGNGALHSVWLGDLMLGCLARAVEEGLDWPLDAQFKVETRCKTWPCGWEKESSTYYFSSQEELDKYVEEYRDWARCEDNAVRITVWEWDLGPTLLADHHFG